MGAACGRRESPLPPNGHVTSADAKAAPGIGAGGPARAKIGSGAKIGTGGPKTIGSGAPKLAAKSGTEESTSSANAGIWQNGARPQKSLPESSSPAASLPGPEWNALQDIFQEEKELQRRREANLSRAREVLKSVCPDAELVKVRSINGRLLLVVDGALPSDIWMHLYECLKTDAFKRSEFARPDTREFKHQLVEYNVPKLKSTDLYQTTRRLVQSLFPPTPELPSPLEAYRIYTNAVMYGDVAFVHRDSNDDRHVTVLVYPNPDWSPELGGETVFYYESGEIADAVEPRPGRLVIFQGFIMHKGSPPGRLFWGQRFTTAFKFAPEDDRYSVPNAGAGAMPEIMRRPARCVYG